jgi:restriction system protein
MYGLSSWATSELGTDEESVPLPEPIAQTEDGLPRASTLSFTDAAERVLDQFGERQPMHYREITDKAIDLGLIRTKGATPEASLNAQIGVEIDRQTRRGAIPRFVRYGKGMIGLSRWTEQGLASRIAEHNAKVRRQLHETLLATPPQQFEALIGRLLVKLGFEEVTVTEYGGDGGIDVRGTLVVGGVIQTRMAVQVKRWKQNVQAPVVQQVRGSLGVHEQGLIITTADFSKGAREEAERPNRAPVALMEGEQLVALLVEHNIGVERQPHDLLMLDLSAEEE